MESTEVRLARIEEKITHVSEHIAHVMAHLRVMSELQTLVEHTGIELPKLNERVERLAGRVERLEVESHVRKGHQAVIVWLLGGACSVLGALIITLFRKVF